MLPSSVRRCGIVAVAQVASLITDRDPTVNTSALMLIATMTSSSNVGFAGANANLAILHDSEAFANIVKHLFADSTLTVALACGACLNALCDLEMAHALLAAGGVDRLNELTSCDVPAVARAATACLHNFEATSALATRTIDAVERVQRRVRKRRLARATHKRLDISRAARCLTPVAYPSPPPSPPKLAAAKPSVRVDQRPCSGPRSPPSLQW